MPSGADDLERLARDLTTAAVTTRVKAGRAMQKALSDIQANAQALAPVDTGFLRSSITTQTTATGGTLRGEVGPTANYGAYVEQGTRRAAAKPYLRPATDRVLPAYERALEQITEGLE